MSKKAESDIIRNWSEKICTEGAELTNSDKHNVQFRLKIVRNLCVFKGTVLGLKELRRAFWGISGDAGRTSSATNFRLIFLKEFRKEWRIKEKRTSKFH